MQMGQNGRRETGSNPVGQEQKSGAFGGHVLHKTGQLKAGGKKKEILAEKDSTAV